MITVTIVEDDPATLSELRVQLEGPELVRVAATASSLQQARRLVGLPHDVCILDVGLPDGDGLSLLPALAERGVKPLVLTVFGDEETALRAIRLGAAGYLLKGERNVVDQVTQVAAGEAPITPRVATHLLKRFRDRRPAAAGGEPALPARLSPRERETLQMLALGHNYRETAEQLGVSYHTVADHAKSIYRKLAVKSKAAAVLAGLRAGVIELTDRL